MDGDAALRVVMDWKEVNTIIALRAENERLNKELKLWKGPTELPVQGRYYTAPEWLMEIHGWTFGYETLLRYDASEWDSYTRVDKKTIHIYVHIFKAPYLDDGKWITFRFETYELHNLLEVEWDAGYNELVRYLDKDDEIRYIGDEEEAVLPED